MNRESSAGVAPAVNSSASTGAAAKTLWSVRVADSVLKRDPNSLTLQGKVPTWNYTQGFMFTALEALYQTTKDKKYWDYIVAYYEGIIDARGHIGGGYNVDEYNLDCITPGKALMAVHDATGKTKFRSALQVLRTQLRDQPRNSLGGFWHKQRYPHQMWLDSLYMGPTFLAQYGNALGEDAAVDEAILQFTLLDKHGRDPKTGLLFHGWDESRRQKWSDPATGLSPNLWGRGMGWYVMALVDTIEVVPENHPKRVQLIAILRRLLKAVHNVQDPTSAVWYQVLDQGSRVGNYLESSASCMFAFAMLKASRLGFVDASYRDVGRRAYEGILKEFIRVNDSGEVDITQGCLGAGLGPDPQSGKYRDGSFEYYINERRGNNATQAVPAFILASLEYER